MSEAEKFQKNLGEDLAKELGQGYKFFRSKLELHQKGSECSNVIVLSGSNKYSPSISVSFHFGKHFEEIRRIEKALGLGPMHYHIQQYSPNLKGMINHPNIESAHTWRVNINNPPKSLCREVCVAMREVSEPFFDRFDSLEGSRDAIASNDSWCLYNWVSVLLFDAALDDIAHFNKWAKNLSGFEKEYAVNLLAKYNEI